MNKLNYLDVIEYFKTNFELTTNQGVVGSIPASRTKLNKGLHLQM